MVVFSTDEPDSIIFVDIVDFLSESFCPKIAIVAPVPVEKLYAPRIAHFYEHLSIAQFICTKNWVSMTIRNSHRVPILVAASSRMTRTGDNPKQIS